jgi:hypothetical protein
MIMQDYLDHIYPMTPVVHRPSFLKALQENQDYEDKGFLALTISMAALVVATTSSEFIMHTLHLYDSQLEKRWCTFATKKSLHGEQPHTMTDSIFKHSPPSCA